MRLRSIFGPLAGSRLLLALAVAGSASLAACTGLLGDGTDGADGPLDDGDGDGDGDDGPINDDGTTGPQGLDPGRVTLHRLNRNEYDNTVRDLLGTSQTPARDFPADDTGYGFDNVADVLSVPPVQLELYELAAESLAAEVMQVPDESTTLRQEGEELTSEVGGASEEGWNLTSTGELPATFEFPSTGDYVIRVRAQQQAAGPDDAQMAIRVAGIDVGTFTVEGTASAVFEVEATVNQGTQVVSAAFLNDYYDPDAGADRNLIVDWIEVEGPIGAVGENPLRDRIVTCDPAEGAACLTQIVEDFAGRAWRRPAAPEEVDQLLSLVDLAVQQGDPVDKGLELAVRAVLSSPHFIFRVELDEDPTSEEPHPVSSWELASRLSYFVWSSMPDQELFDAAASEALLEPDTIRSQIARMLGDERATALTDNFASQWLWTRNLAGHSADYAAFPDWDDELRASMAEETRLFIAEFLRGDQPIASLLSADFAYVDDRLAEHYGLPLPGSDEPVRVSVEAPRGGLLGQASILSVTSFAKRTSPPRRGKWVLEQVLCDAPPDPPAGVTAFPESPDPEASLRERMEQHRADPTCAACHDILDPIGFGLESFDGIGAWRTEDLGGYDIDASGQFPDGQAFTTTAEMIGIVAGDDRFPACVAEKLFVYGLGRGTRDEDEEYLGALAEVAGDPEVTLPELIAAIVTTEPFLMRRGEPEGGDP